MVLYEDTPQMNKKSHHKKQPTSEISIDETKFVTTINTSGMEKKFDSLGDKKQTTENISDNINKLKNIKK
jgi:hypothetical protein